MKKVKGWKTFAYAIGLGLTAIFASPDLKAVIMENFEITGAGISLVVGILRLVTSSPIFKQS